MKIVLDSSFIIALMIKTDYSNKKAVSLVEKGILNNECYISNLIINEVITVIGNKSNKEIANKTYHFLKDNFIIINEYEINNFNEKTIDTYLEYNTKLSFTDSSIVEVMKKNNINKLLSFDKYFDKVDEIKRIY